MFPLIDRHMSSKLRSLLIPRINALEYKWKSLRTFIIIQIQHTPKLLSTTKHMFLRSVLSLPYQLSPVRVQVSAFAMITDFRNNRTRKVKRHELCSGKHTSKVSRWSLFLS